MMIKVSEICGPVCVDPQDGERLCQQLMGALEGGETVQLDFDGVTTLTSSFLNGAIGCLYATFDPEDLARRLTWKGLDRTDEGLIRLVQNNAIRYFSATPTQQEQLLDSGRQATESC